MMAHTSQSLHLSDLGHRLLNSSLHFSLVANTDVAFPQESPRLRCPGARIICPSLLPSLSFEQAFGTDQ